MTHLAVILSGVAFALVAIGIVIALGVMAYKRNKAKSDTDTVPGPTVPKEHVLIKSPIEHYYTTRIPTSINYQGYGVISMDNLKPFENTPPSTLDDALTACNELPDCQGVQVDKSDSKKWNMISNITLMYTKSTIPNTENGMYLLNSKFLLTDITNEDGSMIGINYYNKEKNYAYTQDNAIKDVTTSAEQAFLTLSKALDGCNNVQLCLGIQETKADNTTVYSYIETFTNTKEVNKDSDNGVRHYLFPQ